MNRIVALSLAGAALLMSGCPRGEQAKPPLDKLGTEGQAAGDAPRASVALRVLVVNEPGVAAAINRLRGEWAERSGGQLSAAAGQWKDLAAAKSIDADVVIFPSRYLGELCTRGWLQPVRSSVLEGDEFDGRDVFPLLRRELMRWGGEVMALPLGVQVVAPDKADAGHPGLRFLAVAAPSAVANEREGVLFDPQTMKPRIADPVFVDALEKFAKSKSAARTGEKSGENFVPVLGFGDRLIAVNSASRNGASAFKLAAWLASVDVSTQLNAAGDPLLSVRRAAAPQPSRSNSDQPPGDRRETAKTFEAALNGDRCLLVPRIPGVDEYMAALDEAVKAPPADKVAAAAGLQKVAERWEQITIAHGREAQRQAYLKHLQISQ
jgi:hypothetical protein